ncbi:MAG: hypothetical protein VZQ98_15745 [Bacteroidales bacterium]|jgi:hypothetical protein|nr:hypothetical protein [Bacteroidales bacterium]
MYKSIKTLFQDIKDSGKGIDLLLYSFFWMILSAVAAYPDLCINRDSSVFYLTNVSDYQQKFILPFLLFLGGFMFDFSMATKDLEIGERRGRLFKSLVFSLVAIVVFGTISLVSDCKLIKYGFFLLLWATISIIKGLTILISWSDKNIVVTQPQMTIQ